MHSLQHVLAVSPQSHVIRQLTHDSNDAWPSCTPDGRWLVYQHASAPAGFIVRVPAADCLPLGDPSKLQRLVAGPILGWHAAISPDGRSVAFNASPGGTGRQAWQVYIASLDAASPSSNPTGSARPAIYAASPRGCVDPTWVNGVSSPAGVLVYVCGAQLVAALVDPHSARRIDIIEDTGTIGTILYNPAWIPVP